MTYQIFTLENGLRIVLVDTKTFPTFTAMLLVGAGSRFENKKNNGIAHFFEHMVFKGSKKYPNSLYLSSVIEGLGAIFNAFTTKDHTGYWIKAPIFYFNTVIDVLSDMIRNPLLLSEEIEREKGVIIEEINMYEDQPQYKVWELFEEMIYENNPLGYPITGYKEKLSKFTRQTFLDYIKDLYKPGNVILILAGGLSQNSKYKNKFDNYLQVIQEKFSSWKNGKKIPFLKFYDNQNSPKILIKTKKTEQAHLILGYRGLSYTDKKRYVQSVLMTVLGGGMSSRLFYQLRERRGLCYYINSGSELFSETGYVYTRAGLTVNAEKINEAIKVIISEHQKVASGDLKDKEIKKAKEMIKGSLVLSLEDSHNLASFFGRKMIFEGKIVDLDKIIERIDKINKDEIVDLAKKIFLKEKLNLTLLSPINETKIKI